MEGVTPLLTPKPLAFEAPAGVREALAAIGRTEDLAFSPSARRIAIAAFDRDRILLLDLDTERRLRSGAVALTGYVEITAQALSEPHGVAFLDDHTIIVANRRGSAAVFRLPVSGEATSELAPIQTFCGGWHNRLMTPGSVAARSLGDDRFEVLVCNNYRPDVTRHVLESGDGYRVLENRVLLKRGLAIPDGVAFSPDGRWIAVSNHSRGCVFMYGHTGRLNPRSAPTGLLRNVDCPHGLQFTADGRTLFVASAASPLIHVYGCEAGDASDWRGERLPVTSLQVLDDATFDKGRFNPEEGGPKGVGVADDLSLLAITCEQLPLAFFDLAAAGLSPLTAIVAEK